MGIAAHFGLEVGVPTIGVAKKKLYGEYSEPAAVPASFTSLTDPKAGEEIGTVLRTKNNVKPVFVSPGHLADIQSALTFAKTLVRKHRLPEPTRLAHNLVNAFRRGEIAEHINAND